MISLPPSFYGERYETSQKEPWCIFKVKGGPDFYIMECYTEKLPLWIYGFTKVRPENAKVRELIVTGLLDTAIEEGVTLIEAPKEFLEEEVTKTARFTPRSS